jgi:NagD protein
MDAHSESTAMVGDSMNTDIIAGMEAGLTTFLVLTGITKPTDIERSAFRPSHVVASVADLVEWV